jgi:hypothetical protein
MKFILIKSGVRTPSSNTTYPLKSYPRPHRHILPHIVPEIPEAVQVIPVAAVENIPHTSAKRQFIFEKRHRRPGIKMEQRVARWRRGKFAPYVNFWFNNIHHDLSERVGQLFKKK